MKKFDIPSLHLDMKQRVQDKIDNLTKPKGSLGMLETLAMQICLVQGTLTPSLHNPHNVLFAGDHGIIAEGVSVSPKEVTWQQLSHFLHGGAGINFLCEQHGFKLVLVDTGVDYDIPAGCGIIDKKIRRGTDNFLHGPAMSVTELEQCIDNGAAVVSDIAHTGSNIISFGEMGSGNTSPSSMWMHLFTGIPLEQCIGAGAGLSSPGIAHKHDVLRRALQGYRGGESTIEKMAWFGGFELATAVGAMLKAASLGMLVIVDGFIMTSCMLAASQINPALLDYAIFGHQGDESGHKLMLQHLHAKPLLHLSLRLGEGSGAVCSYPIIQSAVKMINDMDTFDKVNVIKYF